MHESGLPTSAILYESEYAYWPWGEVLLEVTSLVCELAPPGGRVLDYMCGTGYLLDKIKRRRPDLACEGCSLMPEYIEYGHASYIGVDLEICDVFEYLPRGVPDIVLCTAGIHHLSWEKQPDFVAKIAREMHEGGVFLIAEELIRAWDDEASRREGVLELHTHLLRHLIQSHAPIEIIGTAVDVLRADLAMHEFKLDRARLLELAGANFVLERERRVWPPGGDLAFGDTVFVYRRRA